MTEAEPIGWRGRFLSAMVRQVAVAVAALPRRARLFLGDLLGVILFDVLRIRRRVVLDNLALAYPEKTAGERRRLARAATRNLARTVLEYGLLERLDETGIAAHFTFVGLEHLDAALAEGKGVLLLSLHLGNGDLAIAALARRGYPMNVISKRARSPWIDRLWNEVRTRHGTRILPSRGSHIDILRALRRNGIVGFALDQFAHPPLGVPTTFFGRETGTAGGLAVLAERTGAPVLPCYSVRLDDGRHVAHFGPPIETATPAVGPEHDRAIQRMTQTYTDTLERIVRAHPEQWMWVHRRWKPFTGDGPRRKSEETGSGA